MAEIEHNQINWVGIVPAYDMDSVRQYPRKPSSGVQVLDVGSGSNTAVLIRTVTAGYRLYITGCWLTVANSDAAARYASLYIRNGADVTTNYLVMLWAMTGLSSCLSLTFNPAIEVPAGYDICGVSNDADCSFAGGISGYEL